MLDLLFPFYIISTDCNFWVEHNYFLQDEITEMKRKLKIMNHQIDQLKEEITAKENALVKEKLDHQDVEKQKEALKVRIVSFYLGNTFLTVQLWLYN